MVYLISINKNKGFKCNEHIILFFIKPAPLKSLWQLDYPQLLVHYKMHYSKLNNIHGWIFKKKKNWFNLKEHSILVEKLWLFSPPLEGRVLPGIPSAVSHFVYEPVYYSLVILYVMLQLHETPWCETQVPWSFSGLEPQHHIAEQRQVT